MKTLNYKIGNGMRSIVASLIILASFSGISKGENSYESILSGEETTEFNMNSQELANQMKSWMNNSAYWDIEAYTDNNEQELALQMKSWINNSTYWSDDAENTEQDLALQMKSWMNNSAYWTGSEEEFNFSNELANN